MKNYIITIGREFGSGGKEIAQKLAERLGIEYYDKDLVTLAAKQRGVSEEVVADAEENIPSIWDCNSVGLPIFQDRLFLAQSTIITEIAEKNSPCIIVGRCADYVLRDHADVINIFIHAKNEFRIQRIMQSESLTYADAKALVKKTDKTRRAYYQFYTDRKWGTGTDYDLVLSSSTLGIDTCVDILYATIQAYAT